MAEYDKSGWTVYEPVLCQCVGARIASSPIKGIVKPACILELLHLETGQEIIKWLGINKTPKGGYSVKPNSDFAKLYRVTKGYVTKARFSKANQLLKHFVGCEFITEFENAKGSRGNEYLRAKTIKPVNPIITDGWFPDGRLRYKNWKPTGNGLETNWKKSGNELETRKAENPHLNLVSPSKITPLKDITSKIEPYTHVEPIPSSNDEYETTLEVLNGMKIYRGHQQPNETQEQYHERVISESFLSDQSERVKATDHLNLKTFNVHE